MLWLALVCAVSAFDFSAYPNNQSLHYNYTLYWRLEGSRAFFAVDAATTGWVGLGIGEETSGTMPGADFLTGWVAGQETFIQDRYALGFSIPQPDKCSDWTLISGQEEDGHTILEVSRDLVTQDTLQDRPLYATGENRFLWAMGDTDTFRYHGQNMARRGMIAVTLGDESATPEGPLVVEFKTKNATIPTEVTTYMCQGFELPNIDAHIVRLDPFLDDGPSQPLVHHFVAFACSLPENYTSPDWERLTAGPILCNDGNFMMACENPFFTWAPGVGPQDLPPEAGYRMGRAVPWGMTHIVLQTHFDNPNLLEGIVDQSGVRFHYDLNLRKYDAGTMSTGDVSLTFAPIPAKLPAIEYEADCPAACTSEWSHPINVFSSMLHMHQVGARMWTNRWRDGVMDQVNRVDFYDFNLQQLTVLNYTLVPGDRFNVHCIYNTMSRTNETRFGEASQQEMCINFIAYYPLLLSGKNQSYSMCGHFQQRNQNTSSTFCGPIYSPDSIHNDWPNPSVADPPNTAPPYYGNAPEVCPGASSPSEGPAPSASATPDSEPTPSNEPILAPPAGHPPNTGAIIGGVIGGVAGAALLGVVIFLVVKRVSKRGYAPVSEGVDLEGRNNE